MKIEIDYVRIFIIISFNLCKILYNNLHNTFIFMDQNYEQENYVTDNLDSTNNSNIANVKLENDTKTEVFHYGNVDSDVRDSLDPIQHNMYVKCKILLKYIIIFICKIKNTLLRAAQSDLCKIKKKIILHIQSAKVKNVSDLIFFIHCVRPRVTNIKAEKAEISFSTVGRKGTLFARRDEKSIQIIVFDFERSFEKQNLKKKLL